MTTADVCEDKLNTTEQRETACSPRVSRTCSLLSSVDVECMRQRTNGRARHAVLWSIDSVYCLVAVLCETDVQRVNIISFQCRGWLSLWLCHHLAVWYSMWRHQATQQLQSPDILL